MFGKMLDVLAWIILGYTVVSIALAAYRHNQEKYSTAINLFGAVVIGGALFWAILRIAS